MNIARSPILVLLSIIVASAATPAKGLEPTYEELVVDYTEGYEVSLSSSGSDTFLVAYERYDNVNYAQLWALGLDKTGQRLWHRPIGFQRCNSPSVCTLADGSFVVTFRYVGSSSGIPQVLARRFLADGTADHIMRLASGDVSSSHSPGSASGPGDGFTVAWIDGNTFVKTQAFDQVGIPINDPVIVDDKPGVPYRPVSMARTASGVSAYAWFGYEADGGAIRARILDPTRNPVTDSFLVTDYRTARPDIDPVVLMSNTGTLIVAWSDQSGVRYSRYTLEGDELTRDFLAVPGGVAPLGSMSSDGQFAVGATGAPATVMYYDALGDPTGTAVEFGLQLPFESGRSGEVLLLENQIMATALLEARDGAWPDQVYFGWFAHETLADDVFSLDFDPDTFNLSSNGRFVTATLIPTSDRTVDEIDISSLALASVAPTRVIADPDGLTLKFARSDIAKHLSLGMRTQLLMSGSLLDGTAFSATDTIRVIDPRHSLQARTDAKVVTGSAATITWTRMRGDFATQYDGYLSLDNGGLWTPLFSDWSGQDAYTWKVAAPATAKAVLLIEARNPHGIYHAQTPVFQIREERVFEELQSTDEQCLLRAAPNPFNPATQITFELKESQRSILKVYDVSGRLVRTLVDDVLSLGHHSISWNGEDDLGRQVASGVYLYQLRAGDYVMNKRMVLLK